MLRLFVAVILDNLELDEDVKKQTNEGLRSKRNRDRPQLTRLHKVPSDFNLLKVIRKCLKSYQVLKLISSFCRFVTVSFDARDGRR